MRILKPVKVDATILASAVEQATTIDHAAEAILNTSEGEDYDLVLLRDAVVTMRRQIKALKAELIKCAGSTLPENLPELIVASYQALGNNKLAYARACIMYAPTALVADYDPVVAVAIARALVAYFGTAGFNADQWRSFANTNGLTYL